jgi:hypothetical protein
MEVPMADEPCRGNVEAVDHRQGETMFGFYWSAYGAHSRELLPPGVTDVYCDIRTDVAQGACSPT